MKSDFLQALKDRDEIEITVTGRKTGRSITLPVWFAVEEQTLYLLPVQGGRTNWYQNVVSDREVHLAAGEHGLTAHPRLVTAAQEVAHVADLFRARYGAADVAKYYTGLDVALGVALGLD